MCCYVAFNGVGRDADILQRIHALNGGPQRAIARAIGGNGAGRVVTQLLVGRAEKIGGHLVERDALQLDAVIRPITDYIEGLDRKSVV